MAIFVFCRHDAYFGLLFETKRSSSKDYKTSGSDPIEVIADN